MFRPSKRKHHNLVLEEKSLIPWDEMIKKASETSLNNNISDNDITTIKTCSEETDSTISSSSSFSSISSNGDENDSSQSIRFNQEEGDDDENLPHEENDPLLKGEEEMKKLEINLSKYDIATINTKHVDDTNCSNICILGFDEAGRQQQLIIYHHCMTNLFVKSSIPIMTYPQNACALNRAITTQ